VAISIVIALGVDPDANLVQLYLGPSYADGEKALFEAGQEAKIVEGWVFNNPIPYIHQLYPRKMVKRGPGRPPKTATFAGQSG
jgi:hypothetical protein